MKITEKTPLEKILKIKGSDDILRKYSVPCMTCPMMKMEMNSLKIGEICGIYGIDSKKVIGELNKL